MKVAVVANPVSGRGKGGRLIPQIEAVLRSLQVDHSIHESADAGDAIRLAREATEGGAKVVAALGGDGQVGAVANGILEAGAGSALSVIPAGTGNDFARALGLDRKDPMAAARLLGSPHVRSIDAVRLTTPQRNCFYVNIGSAGFDSEVNAYANGLRFVKGTASYVIGVLVMLRRFRPGQFRVAIDGDSRDVAGMLIAVGNAVSYGGGMKVTPGALLDDGLLDVCVLRAVSKFEFLKTFPKVFSGRHVTHPAVQMLRGTRVEVSAEREMQVFADGDHIGTLPATFELLPAALSVVVPRDGDGRFVESAPGDEPA
ncbi:MAG: diacylglycerol kinase family protein [Actinomycetota bacterium]